MASSPTGLDRLLAAKEIAIFCGPGGVGKTSVAAAAAAGAAARLGGKVLVVTVDPARRLADALGVAGLGNREREVPAKRLVAAGLQPFRGHPEPRALQGHPEPRARGGLWAAMLDTKQSWDDLVLRHAPDEETAYRILENRLYDNITARFVQSHDYIAMERLHEIHRSGVYDLIVVDTPPSRNAIDFIEAPRRMAEFFGSPLLKWLTMPYRLGGRRGARMVTLASRPFYRVADRILGSQFLEDIAEFFLNFQSMYEGFVERARAVERLLRDRRTTFVVISTLEPAPVREAEFFVSALAERRLHLGALVLNKTLPDYLLGTSGEAVARALCRDPEGAARALVPGSGGPSRKSLDPATVSRVLHTVGESFLNFSVVAKREAELRAELAAVPDLVLSVPYFEADVHDLTGLARMGDHLFGS
ncbi:MAG: AAA family ATPase [Actinomycetota bacterium]|nr:AAA family ATPase [Actinomycetota bacterium]